MILGYKKKFPWGTETNFKRKIREGIKKHTIRDDKHNRWHAGMKIQHAYGVRSKQYDHFADGEFKSTQKISIKEWNPESSDPISYVIFHKKPFRFKIRRIFEVKVDDEFLNSAKVIMLARNDGFDSTEDFFEWFFNGFEGKIIHFTDLKY